jgi:hypothetical protein
MDTNLASGTTKTKQEKTVCLAENCYKPTLLTKLANLFTMQQKISAYRNLA